MTTSECSEYLGSLLTPFLFKVQSCLGGLLLATQTPQEEHNWLLQYLPTVCPISTKMEKNGPLNSQPEQRNLIQEGKKKKKALKETTHLYKHQMKAIISCIQSPCPVIHCKIWKPGLSLRSSEYQRDAQGQCLHSFMPGSKASSLSEPYWPTYIHKVLTDYKLGRDIKAFTSLQWNTKTLCIVSSLYSPESANKKPHLSLNFGENRAPQCVFHVHILVKSRTHWKYG